MANIVNGKVTAEGRALLRRTARNNPRLYAQVEKHTDYPDQDDYTDSRSYDNAVDRAELRALEQLQKEAKKKKRKKTRTGR